MRASSGLQISHIFTWWKGQGASFIRALIAFGSSGPSHLPEAPPSNIITLDIHRFPTYEWGGGEGGAGDTNIWTIATPVQNVNHREKFCFGGMGLYGNSLYFLSNLSVTSTALKNKVYYYYFLIFDPTAQPQASWKWRFPGFSLLWAESGTCFLVL